MTFFVYLVVKEMFLQVKTYCNGPHDLDMKFMTSLTVLIGLSSCMKSQITYFIEIQHILFESGCNSFGRPLILPCRVPIPADFHALLEVRCFLPQGCNFIRVCRLCNTFSADLDVATVRPRILPCQLPLQQERERVVPLVTENNKGHYLDIIGQSEEVGTLLKSFQRML